MEVPDFTPIAPGQYRAPRDGEAAGRFWTLFERWLADIDALPPAELLRNPHFFATPAVYDQMVTLGRPALPHLMECLADGVFFLNGVVEEIAGVEPPPEIRRMAGEQAVSRWLLSWWDQHNGDFAVSEAGVGHLTIDELMVAEWALGDYLREREGKIWLCRQYGASPTAQDEARRIGGAILVARDLMKKVRQEFETRIRRRPKENGAPIPTLEELAAAGLWGVMERIQSRDAAAPDTTPPDP